MLEAEPHLLPSLRDTQSLAVRVDAWRDGVQLNDSPLPVVAGSVTVDSNSRIRRRLNISFAPRFESGGLGAVSVWDMLAPVGTELRVYRGNSFAGGAELLPLGVFGIEEQDLDADPSGNVQVTASDRWAVVQRARFEVPESSTPGAQIRNEIARLMHARDDFPAANITASSSATLSPTVWERDRDVAIEELARSIGAEAYFSATGVPVVRDVPTMANLPVWLVDAGARGVLLGGNRKRSRQGTYNVVVVTADQIDGPAPFGPVTVEDDDPTSPTYVDGPMGRVPFFYSSANLTTSDQAIRAGAAILERARGLAAQLTLESTVNPALEAGDVIDVILPRDLVDGRLIVERHIIDTVTIPLDVATPQQITTRSSRPDEPAEEATPS